MGETAIVGDIHGNSKALSGLLALLEPESCDTYVFVGDYINRGPESREVVEELISFQRRRSDVTFLRGNHEEEMIRVLAGASAVKLLAMGGATTLTSYLQNPGEEDLAAQLRSAMPQGHKKFFSDLRSVYRDGQLTVSHGPGSTDARSGEFHVYGHIIQNTLVPTISRSRAAIDTGCGTLKDGRLSSLLWPSRRIIQVDPLGRQIRA